MRVSLFSTFLLSVVFNVNSPFFIFALRFAFTLNYFTLLLLLHARISSSGNCSRCIYSLFVSLFVLYPVSRVRFLKKENLSLRKSVKWRFTLKFVFRQIQEGRLLVHVICIYVCNICAFKTNGLVNSQNLRSERNIVSAIDI